ncbi:MAG: ribonuclease HII [Deltaproteobacteria bacterium]|nr:ribonuclease HII [Deltaproteobacteria bacterium]
MAKSSKPKAKAKAKRSDPQPALFLLDDEDPAVVLSRELIGHVGGLDEAGRGPLAGPVVAACVVLPHPLPEPLLALNDSKALDEDAREALFPLILQHAIAWGVAVVEAERIDEINILRASLEAMAISLERCEAMLKGHLKGALLDGNQKAPLPMRITQRTLVGGDAKSRPIMAASILAKVSRDRRMVEEHARFPHYGFDAHKGYGTPQHMAALKLHGASALHRKSFAPVRDAIELAEQRRG